MKGASLKSYSIGFIASIVLTLSAYALVVMHLLPGMILLAVIFGLAFVQLIIQLVYFLHLGAESGGRWKLGMVIATAGLIFVIIGGSIWIMNHLNYSMMASPDQMQKYIDSQQAF